jgi:hypothetical protein
MYLRLSHISNMHAGFTGLASICARVSGHADIDQRSLMNKQATSDYRPENSWKGNGMT